MINLAHTYYAVKRHAYTLDNSADCASALQQDVMATIRGNPCFCGKAVLEACHKQLPFPIITLN
jgi:hypothetical protein